ncbi:MAG TPA: AMP-binding protein, partial [Acidimicrobiia bacterium]|nr:AMP-binding protein [Acidimicrobiia bacterium]
MAFQIADLFEAVADTVPARDAAVAGEQRATYAELDALATRLAHVLRDRGVRAGRHVGCLLGNSIDHLAAILGCYKLRAVPINVNTRYTSSELAYVFDDADLVAVIRDADAPAGDRIDVDVRTADYGAALADASDERDFGSRSGDDHYILYTGGTTGRPKGVVWRQEDIFFAALGGGNPGGPPITQPEEIRASVVNNPAQRLRAFLGPDDPGPPQFVSLALGPLMHASGQWSALGTLLGGGKVVLYDRAHVDMTYVLDLVARERVNAMNIVGDATARPL